VLLHQNLNFKNLKFYFKIVGLNLDSDLGWIRLQSMPRSCPRPRTKKGSSNVKTVKKQTFHKRSTNVPTSNRNETKTSEFVSESAPSKEHILDQIETICSQQDKLHVLVRFQNDIGTFVLLFLTLLKGRTLLR
jgi:hypothetical protein